MEQIVINNRFTVDFSRNTLHDKGNNVKTKFEPRLGNLLSIFIQKQGEVVTREFLFKEIWDNYLGANEGLNQARSFLRKLLDDNEKKIIQTIPKKGYCFNADISKVSVSVPKKQRRFKTPLIVAVIFIIFIIGVFYLLQSNYSSAKSMQADELNQKEISEQDAKNKSALISTKDSFQVSFSSQNQQAESTLIKMGKEDANRQTSLNLR